MNRLKSKVLLAIVGTLILGLGGNSVVAQERPRGVVSINVGKLADGSIQLEYERVINPEMSFYLTPILRFIDKDALFGARAGIKKYLRDTAPEEFWYGGYAALAMLRVMGTFGTGLGGGANTGYKAFITDRFTFEVIAGVEYVTVRASGVSVGDFNVGYAIYIGYAF